LSAILNGSLKDPQEKYIHSLLNFFVDSFCGTYTSMFDTTVRYSDLENMLYSAIDDLRSFSQFLIDELCQYFIEVFMKLMNEVPNNKQIYDLIRNKSIYRVRNQVYDTILNKLSDTLFDLYDKTVSMNNEFLSSLKYIVFSSIKIQRCLST
jgi:hypothetical protein